MVNIYSIFPLPNVRTKTEMMQIEKQIIIMETVSTHTAAVMEFGLLLHQLHPIV